MRVKVWLTGAAVCLAAGACSSGGDDGAPGGAAGAAGTAVAGTGVAGSAGAAASGVPVAGAAGVPTAGAAGAAGVPTAGAAGGAGEPVAGGAAGGAGEPVAGAAGGAGEPVAGAAGGAALPEGCMADYPDPRGQCDLDTGFPGDDACLLPPDPSEGFQIHVGPTDYNNVGDFLFPAGQESSECWVFHTPNDEEVFYQGWELSGRAGTHHIINTMYQSERAEGGFVMCRDPGTGTNVDSIGNLPGASKAYMPREPIAPENANLGRSVPANTSAEADMHYFNYTDGPLLREFWMNLYYVPKEQVTEQANQIRAMGGLAWATGFLGIQPGTDMVYQYECPIDSDGRIIQLLGHYHSHGVRFTSHVRRANGDREKVFEMYDYLEPAIFQYNTCSQNPDFSDSSPGAMTGLLEVHAGDVLEWECHIVNDSSNVLTYSNFVDTGEMCNLWGATVGPNINCVLP